MYMDKIKQSMHSLELGPIADVGPPPVFIAYLELSLLKILLLIARHIDSDFYAFF